MAMEMLGNPNSSTFMANLPRQSVKLPAARGANYVTRRCHFFEHLDLLARLGQLTQVMKCVDPFVAGGRMV